jgi:tetratricopeptide (TPR) repeat protein
MSKQFQKKTDTVVTGKSVLFLIPVSGKSVVSFNAKLPEIKEKLKGNASVMGFDPSDPTEALQQISEGIYTHVGFADMQADSMLNAGYQSFSQQRNLKTGVIYCADAHHNQDGKKQVKIPLGTRIMHALQKLVTPLKTGHTESGLFFTDVETATEILNIKALCNTNIKHDFAYRLKLNGYHVGYFGLNLQGQPAPKPSFLKILWSGISNRWYWFISEPLRALKSGSGKQISNGNNPIYRLAFGVILMIASIGMPALSFDYTITWDEHEDVGYFNEVYAYFKTFGEDKRCLDVEGTMDHSESGVNKNLIPHLVNYGPFVNLLSAFVDDTISPLGLYETRHLIIALFGIWGLIFTGLVARKLGSWRTALIALVFMLLTPTIFGHSMNNQKDIPFLAFYISAVFYILRFVDEAPQFRFKTLFMLAVTMGITMSIRVGGLLVFAYLGLFAGLLFLWKVYKKELTFNFANIKSFAVPLILVYFFAYIIGIMFWPAALQDPLSHPFSALKNFEKFSLVHIYEIFEGQRYYMKDFPWYYIPKSMLITIPLFVLAGFAISLLGIPLMLKKYDWKKIGILLFVCLFPIAYIIYKKSAVYSSWRHLLFAYPAIVALAAGGWDMLINLFKMKWIKVGVAAVMTALVANVGIWMVKNHPYQYLYYNEIVGGLKGAYGYYETDYWCQSPRAAVEWLLKNEKGITHQKTTIISNNESHSMSYYAQKQTDSIEIAWARDHEWNKHDWDYAIWTTRTLSKEQMLNGYFPPKGTIHVIEAGGIPIAAVVKRTNRDLFMAENLMKERNFDSSMKHCIAYTKYDPKEEEAYRQWGLNLLQMNRISECFAPFYKSIELCPENYYSWNYLGYAYRNTNNLDSAMICYNQSIKYKENMSSAYDGRGDLYLSKGDFRSAKMDYEQCLSFGGANPMTMYKIGEANLNLNDLNEALKYYGAAIQYNPNMGEAHMRIGQILERQGNKQGAAQYYQKAQELGMR